jgi:hypothetical protein
MEMAAKHKKRINCQLKNATLKKTVFTPAANGMNMGQMWQPRPKVKDKTDQLCPSIVIKVTYFTSVI